MIKDIEGLVEHITTKIRENVDVAVVGMSGGVDSTLVAILSTLALGKENVYSAHMPMNQLDKDTFNSNSQDVAKKLGIKIINCPVNTISHAIVDSLEDALDIRLSVINAGNARSRARMTVLYGIAHALNDKLQRRVRVMGTGNLSEDFIGYDTKGGDALCDIFPIGQLFKSEVYQLLEYFRDQGLIAEENIDRVPSAGLWDGQTDEEELGHSYNDMEPIIKYFMENGLKESDLHKHPTYHFVAKMHFQNKHKHEGPPVIEGVRGFCD